MQTKTVYENPNPQGYSTGDIAWSALEGFVDGGKAMVLLIISLNLIQKLRKRHHEAGTY